MAHNAEYNKLVIFDLDGVLIDSSRLHYEALNEVLIANGFDPITWAENIRMYDGLPTAIKLDMYAEEHQIVFSASLIEKIVDDKLEVVVGRMREFSNPDTKEMFEKIREKGYLVAIATNNSNEVARTFIEANDLWGSISTFQCKGNVHNQKPHPEVYWNCMEACYAIPATTVIVEDSHIGRQGAVDSGARLIAVKDSYEVTLERIMSELEYPAIAKRVPWMDPKLTVLVPMAGAGSRFEKAGYTFPKPLIEVFQKPMIEVVLNGLNVMANYVFIVQEAHRSKYDLDNVLGRMVDNPTIISVDGVTEGAACTTLLAKEYINDDDPLLIVNSDQYVEWNSNQTMYSFSNRHIDGGIVTFKATHPKWSYVSLDAAGFAGEIAEKRVISDHATAGFYYWQHGSDYVKYTEQMIAKNIRVNGEFYVAPVYNEAIADGKKIITVDAERMWGLGVPEDLNFFLEHYDGDL